MDTGKAALGGLDGNLAAALGYPIGIIALISAIIEKENRFVKFHALQSLFFGIGGAIVVIILQIVLGIIGGILSQVVGALGFLVFLLVLVLWLGWLIALIYAAVKAYGGAWFKLPIVGNIAEGMAK